MLKSMTGYGRNEAVIGGKKIFAEIKSVNHRFADYSIKVPRYMGFLEDRARQFISKRITRGKVDIFISVESYEQSDKDISLNEELAANYIKTLHELRDKFGLKDDISVMSVARYTEIFRAERRDEDEDEVWRLVETVLSAAADDFVSMREREGARIESDLRDRISLMSKLTKEIEKRSPETVLEYQNRLYAKLEEILQDRSIDDSRILTEAAIFADKVAVNEETVRLSSHFNEVLNIINSGEPAGRRLDFVIQEINREVNTIGSKAQDIEIGKTVVALKGEIEKLREQIQNIE